MQEPWRKSKTQKIIYTSILIVVLLISGGAGAYYMTQRTKTVSDINSFDECAAATNVIIETYPEQCITPDGRHFTKKY